MPTMDMVCFYGGDENKINFINGTVLEKYTFKQMKEKVRGLISKLPKLRY
jgi:hypothetical protein